MLTVYTWEVSNNGVGGWGVANADDDTSDQDLSVDGKGKYYRVVVTYEDEAGFDERIVSPVIKLGKLAGPTTAPSITGSLASLFQDADSDDLTFEFGIPDGANLGTDEDGSDAGSLYTGNEQLVTFDSSTGRLTWQSDPRRGTDGNENYDGTETDEQGNLLAFTLTADDGSGNTAVTYIKVRINAAPTGVTVTPDTATITETKNAVAVKIADLDVQDLNDGEHKFGTHTFASIDSRFEIRYTGGAKVGARGASDSDDDGSTWELWLKKGAAVDFNERGDAGNSITIRFTATDGGGESSPFESGQNQIVITVLNDPDDDTDPADTVPGLKDDEDDGDPTDTEEDGASDDDQDGGLPPLPPPAMATSLDEDFAGLDSIEEDLLDSFVLAIDDIDVA